MFFAGTIVNSLMIDRLEKKWAARCLFLLVITISICSNLWPMGDTDYSNLINWMNEVSSNPSIFSSGKIVLPIITTGNLIYFAFTLAVVFVYILIAILYSRIFVGEKSGQRLSQSCLSFLKRLPVLVAFYILVSIPVGFLSGIVPIAAVFVVPALFFSPILITLEKKNPIDAITLSYRHTKGVKFSIFWDLLTLFCMYQTAEWLFLLIMPNASSAGILLHAFFTGYFILSFGRMSGIFYDRLLMHPAPEPPVTPN